MVDLKGMVWVSLPIRTVMDAGVTQTPWSKTLPETQRRVAVISAPGGDDGGEDDGAGVHEAGAGG